MWDIVLSPALAKKGVNPELATETVNVDELSKVRIVSDDKDTVEIPSAFTIPELFVLWLAPDLTNASANTCLWLVKLVFAIIPIGFSYSKFIKPN